MTTINQLLDNLPLYQNDNKFWDDESLVNAVWSAILTAVFPVTGAASSYFVCPEMIKGTATESYKADLAIMQVSGPAPYTATKPVLCFEGKSASGESFDKAVDQIKKWTVKAHVGMYGRIWGIAARGNLFQVLALDRQRNDSWYNVELANPPIYNTSTAYRYDITSATHINALKQFLAFLEHTKLPNIPPQLNREHPFDLAPSYGNPFLEKISTLARLHVLLGSTREVFEADITARGLKDDTPTKRLTKEQFDAVNKAIVTVKLNSDDSSTQEDQATYDHSSMLATMVNTRNAAVINKKRPDGYDVTKPEDQLAMVNDSAYGLFNAYNSQLAAFISSKNFWQQTIARSYATLDIETKVVKDLFASLALPEAALEILAGTAKTLVTSLQQLSASIAKKGLQNVQLINFYSVQPPVGNPNLKHVCVMRMIYVKFQSALDEWSTACAKGSTYKLEVGIFGLDVQLNKEVVDMTYDYAKQLIIKDADTTLDFLGSGGAANPTSVDSGKPSPIGPPPTS